MQFKGIYTDAINPAEADAVITLLQDQMIIEIPFRGDSHEWFYGMIRKKKQRGAAVTLLYKDTLKGRLVISNPQLLQEVNRAAPYASFTQSVPWYQSGNGIYSMVVVKIGTIVTGILLFIVAVPLLINFIVNRISIQSERNLGNRMEAIILDPLDEDTMQTRLVKNFFSHLSPPGNNPIYFTVINSGLKNAFTLPGGHIVIENGIFSSMQHSSELVALMGHECGHAINRDPLKMLCRESATTILLLTLTGNLNGVINKILSNASYLRNLTYSREYESAADRFAYEWMKKNKINPHGITDLLLHLKEEDQRGIRSELISSHPSINNRMKKVNEWVRSDRSITYRTNPGLQRIWRTIKMSSTPEHTH
ncbi:MAG: M48 family metallopeptidase [Chitinophagales bacterium]